MILAKLARDKYCRTPKTYTPDSLIGVRAVFVFNLEPRKLMGLESQGMLLAAESEECPMILVPYKDAPPGSIIN